MSGSDLGGPQVRANGSSQLVLLRAVRSVGARARVRAEPTIRAGTPVGVASIPLGARPRVWLGLTPDRRSKGLGAWQPGEAIPLAAA